VRAGWIEAPVSALLANTVGGTWGKAPGEDEVDVTVVRVADFRDNGTVDFASAPTRSVTQKQLESRELQEGDLLLEKSGGGPTKAVGRVVRIRPDRTKVVPTNFVQLLRPTRAVDSGYVFWWLWWSHLNGSSIGFQRATTNIRNLRTSDYLDRPMPLPPLAEQRRIVAAIEEHLSRLDAAVAQVGVANERLRKLRSRIVDRATAGPWQNRPFDHVIQSLRNGVFVSRPNTQPPGIPIFRISAVRSMALDVGDIRYAPPSETFADECFVEEGDLLFTRYSGNPAYVGACAVVPPLGRKTLHPDKLIRVTVDREHCLPEYIEIAFASTVVRREVELRLKTTAGQVGIAGGQLRTVPLPLPPLEVQRQIVADVRAGLSAADALLSALQRASLRAVGLRRSILARAFRGELVVPDPNDEPARVLLERIEAERAAAPAPTRKRRVRSPA
jgi:restriction endonuclease S subunit